jgi:hypothetical protein
MHYYFDTGNQLCRRFILFDCPSNGNDFATQFECEATCLTNLSAVTGVSDRRSYNGCPNTRATAHSNASSTAHPNASPTTRSNASPTTHSNTSPTANSNASPTVQAAHSNSNPTARSNTSPTTRSNAGPIHATHSNASPTTYTTLNNAERPSSPPQVTVLTTDSKRAQKDSDWGFYATISIGIVLAAVLVVITTALIAWKGITLRRQHKIM